MGVSAGCFDRRSSGRYGHRSFTYLYGNPGNPGRNPDTAWTVFCEFEDYGKIQSGDQCSLRYIKNVPIYRNTILLVAVIIVVLIAFLYWFFGTELGCSLRATGCNDRMSRAQGINTDFNRVLGLMISNGLVAFSGALLSQYQGFADINMGRGAIVIGLAAVIIGEALFGKIFHNFGFRLLGVALGSIVYYFVLQIVIWLGIDTDLLKLLSAAVVAVFLAIPYWQSKYFSRPVKRGGDR